MGSFRAPANSCSDTPSNAAICPCTPGNATRWSMPCGGSALLQDPVALPCRWAFSLACTQTLQPCLQPWFGIELGVCGTYSFNDSTWGKKEDEGEGESGLEIVYKELPRGMNSGAGHELDHLAQHPPSFCRGDGGSGT